MAYHAMAPTASSAINPITGATQLRRVPSGGTAVAVPSNRSRAEGSSGPSGVYAAALERGAAEADVAAAAAALAAPATGAAAGTGSPMSPASSLRKASRDALTSPSVGL